MRLTVGASWSRWRECGIISRLGWTGEPRRAAGAGNVVAVTRVLLLDDSELALEVEVMMFERKGYEVRGCLDLDEMRAAATELVPDVVVTDVGLGDTSIEEACSAIRESFGQQVPLLLYSGREDDELEALVAALGVDGFINKSDPQNIVIEKIETAIRACRGRPR